MKQPRAHRWMNQTAGSRADLRRRAANLPAYRVPRSAARASNVHPKRRYLPSAPEPDGNQCRYAVRPWPLSTARRTTQPLRCHSKEIAAQNHSLHGQLSQSDAPLFPAHRTAANKTAGRLAAMPYRHAHERRRGCAQPGLPFSSNANALRQSVRRARSALTSTLTALGAMTITIRFAIPKPNMTVLCCTAMGASTTRFAWAAISVARLSGQIGAPRSDGSRTIVAGAIARRRARPSLGPGYLLRSQPWAHS